MPKKKSTKSKVKDQVINDKYAIYHGDCIEVMQDLPDESVDFSVYSPPFADLYSYSDDDRDFGNSKNYDEFFKQYDYLIKEHYRTMKPGRLIAIHCIDIPAMLDRDGYIGLKDFPGDILRHFQDAGFIYHARITVWKDPLIEAVRTKSKGLNYGQLCKDSTSTRVGIPDYVIVVRKPGENQKPVSHKDGIQKYYGAFKQLNGIKSNGDVVPVMKSTGKGVKHQHNIFRNYASPVWFDINQTKTLNKAPARDGKDVRHICPLQLDLIYRLIQLYSNPGEFVLTPFMGIGSEVYAAVKSGRNGIGIELKDSYFKEAVKNCKKATLKKRKKVIE